MATKVDVRRYDLFIGGEFVKPAAGNTRDSVRPSDGEVWATVGEADANDVDRAVASARMALLGPWGRTLPRERGEMLRRLADLVVDQADRLIEIEANDNGKTIRELKGHYTHIPTWYRYYAGLADKLDGRTLPAERPDMFNYTLVEPIGVVAGITPWNSPGLQVAFKAAPALAAGNTLVLKPSEYTPVLTLEMAKLFTAAGFPDGVVNVVTGGGEAGAALAGHPDVDLVVFTGSDVTGRKVGAAAGAALSSVILELGGKSPQLIFKDADIEAAVIGVMAGTCVASGQTCIAGSRVYVQESLLDEFATRLADRMAELTLGDPLDPMTEVGPICYEEHLQRIESFCTSAVSEGATALVGGERASEEDLRRGFYFKPTLFTDVTSDMTIMRDEVFGPVLGLTSFRDEDEVVALANDTRFGLAAGVWTTDLGRTHRLTRALEAGTIFVNNYRMSSPQTPLTGFKHSGVGMENGQDSLRQFIRQKAIWLDYSGQSKDPFKM